MHCSRLCKELAIPKTNLETGGKIVGLFNSSHCLSHLEPLGCQKIMNENNNFQILKIVH